MVAFSPDWLIDFDVVPHDRCGMGHPDVNKVADAGKTRCRYRALDALEIDVVDLKLLPWSP
jgi:hypothetical protein